MKLVSKIFTKEYEINDLTKILFHYQGGVCLYRRWVVAMFVGFIYFLMTCNVVVQHDLHCKQRGNRFGLNKVCWRSLVLVCRENA